MTLYFFHIDGDRQYVDTDGVELADLEAARKEALRIIGELIVDNAMGDIWSGGEWVMTVADETGRELFSIRLSTSQRNGAGSDQADLVARTPPADTRAAAATRACGV